MTGRKQTDRWRVLQNELARVDGVVPSATQAIEKHRKMARSPFQFLRGSAQLFYADLASGQTNVPEKLLRMPLTRIVGDCHFANFGFFTEEGSHSPSVIFAPNDFDDPCEGPAVFDLLRFLASLHLVRDYLEGLSAGRYSSDEIDTPIPPAGPSVSGARKACAAFLQAWSATT